MPRGYDNLYLDFETRSIIDLRKVGLRRYARDKTTDMILCRFRLNDAPQIEVRRGQPLPAEIREAILDPAVMLVAHNYRFEYDMLEGVLAPRYGWPAPPPLERWHCTMAQARSNALPGNLEDALIALDHKIRKDREGQSLMLRMCRPRKLHDDARDLDFSDEGRFTRFPDVVAEWWWDEQRLARLGAYCGLDVDGSRAIDMTLPPMPASERAIWLATEKMNALGVRFDIPFIRRALDVAAAARVTLDDAMADVTGNRVPAASNVAALKRWLLDQGVDLSRPPDPFVQPEEPEDDEIEEPEEEDAKLPELRRNDVLRLLADEKLQGPAREALRIRLEAGKTSARKLDAILRRADARGYAYGLIAYHGATTGRDSAAGSGVQAQNFPRDGVEAIYPGCTWDDARVALDGGADAVEALVGPPLDVISRMLRGAILPDEGDDLISADYSAVELRGVAWLAGQDDLVEDLRKGAKVYERMAGTIFARDPAQIAKDSRERWVGKQTVLGSGYQMGAWKFWMQCLSLGQPVSATLAIRSIRAFRDLYPMIPRLWYALDEAAIKAVRNPRQTYKCARDRIRFHYDDRTEWLRMQIPSGRMLRYRKPRIEVDPRFDREGVVFLGVNPKTKQWGRRRAFGGFWAENAVQATCRDLMMAGDARVTAAGYRPIIRVHDELVRGIRRGQGSIEEVVRLMCVVPDWAPGFPLTAEAWRGTRYG